LLLNFDYRARGNPGFHVGKIVRGASTWRVYLLALRLYEYLFAQLSGRSVMRFCTGFAIAVGFIVRTAAHAIGAAD